MSPEAALVVEMGAQRQASHSLVRVRCTPMSRDGSADAASAISRNHGPGTITEPHVTSPRAASCPEVATSLGRGGSVLCLPGRGPPAVVHDQRHGGSPLPRI